MDFRRKAAYIALDGTCILFGWMGASVLTATVQGQSEPIGEFTILKFRALVVKDDDDNNSVVIMGRNGGSLAIGTEADNVIRFQNLNVTADTTRAMNCATTNPQFL